MLIQRYASRTLDETDWFSSLRKNHTRPSLTAAFFFVGDTCFVCVCVCVFLQWKETALRRYDPPLSALGHQQARETGLFLDQLLSKEGITAERVTWLSSPYLRTLQTSDGAIQAFSKLDSDQIRVCPEDGVSEYDSHNLQMHHDLPTDRSERLHYFPRLDLNYQSTLVPTMPGKYRYTHTHTHKSRELHTPHTACS